MPRIAFGNEFGVYMGQLVEPIDEVYSVEINPSVMTADRVPILSGPNIVAPGMTVFGSSIAFGASEMLGPRPPFAEPSG